MHEHTTGPWQPPQPQQLPDFRARLARWLADHGSEYYLCSSILGAAESGLAADPAQSAALLAVKERSRVTKGDLYWVSPEMAQLTRHAGHQLDNLELQAHELPASQGFMLFAAPVAHQRIVTDSGETPIVALSWSRHLDGDQVWLTFYTTPCGTEWPSLGLGQPPLLPGSEVVLPLGQPIHPGDAHPDAIALCKTASAAWLLLRQPLATTTQQRAPRAARRRLQRSGLPDPPVQIVHVRRRGHPNSAPSTPGTSRDYACQWWVTGHWRQYHCGPGRERTERRYINAYVAGPDDKPLRITDRVNVWDR